MPRTSSASFAPVFADHMVLQRETSIRIWGTGKKGSTIRVCLGPDNVAETTVEKDGHWILNLDPEAADCRPRSLELFQDQQRTAAQRLHNILIGDVWLCSGQSNMAWTVAQSANNVEEANNADYPNIRLCKIPNKARLQPKMQAADVQWHHCDSEHCEAFSAVAYYFARHLHRQTGVPIGLINSSWGGTIVEAWTSQNALCRVQAGKRIYDDYATVMEKPDTTTRAAKKAHDDWAKKHYHPDTINNGAKKGWHKADFDTSTWPSMDVPGNWQNAGHPFSGIFWFQKTITIPKAWLKTDLTLSLGALDKSDTTYVNGHKVGGLDFEGNPDAWCTPRVYTVPKSILKAGTNTISVRIHSHMHQGGFIGQPRQLFIEPIAGSSKPIKLAGSWRYQIEANYGLVAPPPAPPLGENNPNSPCILYDNMIKPLLPMALKGCIWYQGESNASRAKAYRQLFPNMIENWREDFQAPALPFYFVQLANFNPPAEIGKQQQSWPYLRDAQLNTLKLAHTGMAVIIDVGDPGNIHPANKQDVGYRLALPALHHDYGFNNLVYSGPVFKQAILQKRRVQLYFDHSAGGLKSKDAALTGFEISSDGKSWFNAKSVIKGDHILVWHPQVKQPQQVRYGWSNNPDCNLYNSSDLPASPFICTHIA